MHVTGLDVDSISACRQQYLYFSPLYGEILIIILLAKMILLTDKGNQHSLKAIVASSLVGVPLDMKIVGSAGKYLIIILLII